MNSSWDVCSGLFAEKDEQGKPCTLWSMHELRSRTGVSGLNYAGKECVINELMLTEY